MTATGEPWMTKKEIAEWLKVSISTVERRVTPTIKVGGQNRYLKTQVEAQLAGHQDPLPDNVRPLRPNAPDIPA